ncbi:SHOCT domain-containing protein [Desulfosporosinus sp.]|uniref:SHOCT domain-containing protein n=1 Tax=Desulfosporosinus sp. TaxID=157907 RepID=UPI0026351DC6|nr:SHOCT domain-containing protein [Desulfosporosinus sp.]
MFGGWGCGLYNGGGLWGIGIQFFLLAILVGLCVFLFKRFLIKGYSHRDSALNVLNERFARSEIDLEEYSQRKKELLR